MSGRYPDKYRSHDKSKSYDRSRDRSHDKPKSYDRFRDRSHDKSPSSDRFRDRSHDKSPSSDRFRDRSHDKSPSYDRSRVMLKDSDRSRSSRGSSPRPAPAPKDSDRSRSSRGSSPRPAPAPKKSTSTVPLNPKPFINSLQGTEVNVKLKWGMEYRGKLKSADTYMNLELENAEEYIDKVRKSVMKVLLIRCNNILYMHKFDRKAFEEEERRLEEAEKIQNNNGEESAEGVSA